MPQLDSLTFLSQVFWLVILFISFYVVVAKNVLPEFGFILKTRTKKISNEIVKNTYMANRQRRLNDILNERKINTWNIFITNVNDLTKFKNLSLINDSNSYKKYLAFSSLSSKDSGSNLLVWYYLNNFDLKSSFKLDFLCSNGVTDLVSYSHYNINKS